MSSWHQSTLAYAFCKRGNAQDYGSQSICVTGISHTKTACLTTVKELLGLECYNRLVSEGYEVLQVKISIND